MKANEFLKKAELHLIKREVHYDKSSGERSIPKVVKCFNEITGHSINEEEGWMFMIILKLVRTQQGKFKEDSYEDMVAYGALMGEEASKIKKNNASQS